VRCLGAGGPVSFRPRCRVDLDVHSIDRINRGGKPTSSSGDCRHCGAQFKRRRKTAIYCSSKCSEKVNTLRAIRRRMDFPPKSSRIPGSARSYASGRSRAQCSGDRAPADPAVKQTLFHQNFRSYAIRGKAISFNRALREILASGTSLLRRRCLIRRCCPM
jgi:hypothetical protein